MTIVLSMVNTWLSLFYPYFRTFPPGTQFLNLMFLWKYVQKDVNLNMNILSNTLSWLRGRLGVHFSHIFPRFERMDFLLVSSSLMVASALHSVSSSSHWLSSSAWRWHNMVYYIFCCQKVNFTSPQIPRFSYRYPLPLYHKLLS